MASHFHIYPGYLSPIHLLTCHLSSPSYSPTCFQFPHLSCQYHWIQTACGQCLTVGPKWTCLLFSSTTLLAIPLFLSLHVVALTSSVFQALNVRVTEEPAEG